MAEITLTATEVLLFVYQLMWSHFGGKSSHLTLYQWENITCNIYMVGNHLMWYLTDGNHLMWHCIDGKIIEFDVVLLENHLMWHLIDKNHLKWRLIEEKYCLSGRYWILAAKTNVLTKRLPWCQLTIQLALFVGTIEVSSPRGDVSRTATGLTLSSCNLDCLNVTPTSPYLFVLFTSW